MATGNAITTFLYRRVFIVAFLLIILMGGGFYVFVLSEKLQYLHELEIDKEQNAGLLKKQSHLKLLKELNSNYKNLDESIKQRIDDILPTKKQLPELFTQLETLARENGIVVLSLNVTEIDADKRNKRGKKVVQSLISRTIKDLSLVNTVVLRKFELKKLQIILKIGGGNYRAFKNFITSIQNNVRLMDITSLRFEPRAEGYDIHLSTYYLQNKSAIKKK